MTGSGPRRRPADAPQLRRVRDLLTRLLEASAALSGWQARTAEGAGVGSDSLSDLARELDEEGRRQEDAAREVAALLV